MMLEDRIVRPKEIKSITGLSPVTIWRMEKIGQFPKRSKLSTQAVGWRLTEIHDWMQNRKAVTN